MGRLCVGIVFFGTVFVLVTAPGMSQTEEPFAPKGSYTQSVHRYFPDLDARLNAVRYARWRAVEIAWIWGINDRPDREFSSYARTLIAERPRFAPEADRVAPRFAREAVPIFRALRWGQVLEQQVLDVLAAPDATPRLDEQRLTRLVGLYRRERWALSEPSAEIVPTQAMQAAPVSTRILVSGTRLFALAAEDLAAADFGQQRWRVKETVEDFDRSFVAERPLEQSRYRVAAPTVFSRFPPVADSLDRIGRFRAELFEALVSGGQTAEARRERDEGARQLARRWGIPDWGIGGR